jgi:archaellum biogenesis protein FlaJ (TadC family)
MIKNIDNFFRFLSVGAAFILIPGAWWNVLTPAFWAPFAAIISCLTYAMMPRRLAVKSTALRSGSLVIISLSLLLPSESMFFNLKSRYAEQNWLQTVIEAMFAISMICLFFLVTQKNNKK